MFGGLPGGSPGPNAIGTRALLIFVFLFAVAAGVLMLWFMFHVAREYTLTP